MATERLWRVREGYGGEGLEFDEFRVVKETAKQFIAEKGGAL